MTSVDDACVVSCEEARVFAHEMSKFGFSTSAVMSLMIGVKKLPTIQEEEVLDCGRIHRCKFEWCQRHYGMMRHHNKCCVM